ncbi:CHAP domain-containing protein [Sabulicella glaciei]|uniref:CHAP domain-containing protein n=1 Tax=Sabulicella glaciei TaxID=2984948 RepID=A0ABT3NUJ7_9PROT|nr:CHAP domain-containing protein [Roseococcus sp. MDT2-1-1]MCW8085840.1 CHAP domain-containing protein [Roseococcus sp. MDT2-1-1]
MLDRRGLLGLSTLLALSGCGTSRAPRIPGVPEPGPSLDLSCVPYARSRSGIQLRGDAWQWWEAAAGRYARGSRPEPGAVLVLARTSRLPQGHLAVVRRVSSSREIRVDHANWASGSGRGRIAEDQPVLDVSPGNDWTVLRVWYPRVGDYGATAFAAHGFIAPRLAFAAG